MLSTSKTLSLRYKEPDLSFRERERFLNILYYNKLVTIQLKIIKGKLDIRIEYENKPKS